MTVRRRSSITITAGLAFIHSVAVILIAFLISQELSPFSGFVGAGLFPKYTTMLISLFSLTGFALLAGIPQKKWSEDVVIGAFFSTKIPEAFGITIFLIEGAWWFVIFQTGLSLVMLGYVTRRALQNVTDMSS